MRKLIGSLLALCALLAACYASIQAQCFDVATRNLYPPAVILAYTEGNGTKLRTALNTFIHQNTTFRNYASTWNSLFWTDGYPNATVRLLYSRNILPTGDKCSDTYTSPYCWNREHLWPTSKMRNDNKKRKWIEGNVKAAVDLHHLYPANSKINRDRDSHDFAPGGTSFVFNGTTYKMTATTFEPPDEVKGDVARALFYMDVMYDGAFGNTGNLTLVDSNATSTNDTNLGNLAELLTWHTLDPVSDWERTRNSRVHFTQGNRNPFIDCPEFVSIIWPPANATNSTP